MIDNQIPEFIQPDGYGRTCADKCLNPFQNACRLGNMYIVKFIVKSSTSDYIEQYYDEALRGACLNGHIKVVRYLTNKFYYGIYNDKMAKYAPALIEEILTGVTDVTQSYISIIDILYQTKLKWSEDQMKYVNKLFKEGFKKACIKEDFTKALFFKDRMTNDLTLNFYDYSYITTLINNKDRVIEFVINNCHMEESIFELVMEHAGRNNMIKVVEFICKKIPNCNKDIYEATEKACIYGNFEIVKYVVNKYNIDDKYLWIFLNAACDYGHLDIFEYLLPLLKNIRLEYFFILACRKGHLNIVKYIVKYNNGNFMHCKKDESFYIACESGNVELVKYILEFIPEPVKSSWYEHTLYRVIEKDSFEILKILLSIKSNLNPGILKRLLDSNKIVDDEILRYILDLYNNIKN